MMRITLLLFFEVCRASNIVFNVPQTATADTAKLDVAPVAFSFEFTEFANYFVNISNTHSCLANFQRLTGKWPSIRIGGTSQDRSTYNKDLAVPKLQVGTLKYEYGPDFLKIAAAYQGNVVLGLNRGADNITNTIEGAKAAKVAIHNLYAVELGNEPVIFGYVGFPIAPSASAWTSKAEAASEAAWQIAVGEATGTKQLIRAGNFYLPITYGSSAAQLFANENVTAIQYIRDFSHHNYPQTMANSTVSPPPNLTALMSHVFISANVGLFAADTKVTKVLGMDYVFGETNSVSGEGSPVISQTFGAALWVLDYTLRATSTGISRLHFHHGPPATSFYTWWTPDEITSPYYGGYAAAAAMAGGSYISILDDGSTNYAGYIIFCKSGKPLRLVLINSDFFDGTGKRTTQNFQLRGIESRLVKARRLTAASAVSRQDRGDVVAFGGITFSNRTCEAQGRVIEEWSRVNNNLVTFAVAASEALIIDL